MPCTKCNKNFKTGVPKVGCGFCGKWFHIVCEKVSEELFNLLAENPQIHWYCEECNRKAPEVIAVIQKCTKDNEDMKKEITEMKGEMKKLREGTDEELLETIRRVAKEEIEKEKENAPPLPTVDNPRPTVEEIRELAKKEIHESNDKKGRESCIVLAGIIEQKEAETEVADILTHLGVDVHVFGIRRLGKDPIPGKNRQVWVKLANKKERELVLDKAKLLRDEERWKYVFINKDMTKEESKKAFDLRVELRKRRAAETAANGNAIFVISRGRVIKKAEDREPATEEDGSQADPTEQPNHTE